jgi:hypothetical protein
MRSVTYRQTVVALLTVASLAACSSQKEALIAKGYEPAYADGYEDGCSSGKAAESGVFSDTSKDASRYNSDAQYTQGWDEGFKVCKEQMEEMVRAARRRNPSRDN